MREIKFRAWNGESMTTDFFMDGAECKALTYNFHEFDSTDWPLMQYTGLKDCNGVEIFEGDIVYVAGDGNCSVNWCATRGMWLFGDNDYYDLVEDMDSLRVIGNIHQHPELLECEEN